MTSLHYITHAVSLAVIATLVRKYLQLQFAYEALEDSCHRHSCEHAAGSKDSQREGIGTSENLDSLSDFGTSLWCHGQNRTDRKCKFENLCYNSLKDDFVFVHHKCSIIDGVDPEVIHNDLLELSSVGSHNIHYFRLVDLPRDSMKDFSVSWIKEEMLIFNRFKPDNIMHVMHDDIFPLHHTLAEIAFGSEQKEDVRLMFNEGWEMGEYEALYTYFTTKDIITKEKLKSMNEMVCFKKGHIGLSKKTTWYQYGFDEHQGPLGDSRVTARHIRTTVDFLVDRISQEHCRACDNNNQYLVLISRRENRLILNEAELALSIASETGFKVIAVSFETHNINEMMRIVRYSRGVIGMHGSLMILSAFLQPGSVVVELFPYAVNPRHYTPYKTLASIKDMDLTYKAWSNTNKEKTVMHPDWPEEVGGIHDLSKEEQTDIINQSEVPLHLCCDDPSWLFHIYQDTYVDVPVLVELLKQSLAESNKFRKEPKTFLLPGPVKHVTCDVISGDLVLSWERPWNVMYISHEKVEYEIWLQNTVDENTLSIIVGESSSYEISKHVKQGITYNVWVRCLLDQSTLGSFSNAIKCANAS